MSSLLTDGEYRAVHDRLLREVKGRASVDNLRRRLLVVDGSYAAGVMDGAFLALAELADCDYVTIGRGPGDPAAVPEGLPEAEPADDIGDLLWEWRSDRV